jgi:MerR family mercuric resistance operon transcriptional regulator
MREGAGSSDRFVRALCCERTLRPPNDLPPPRRNGRYRSFNASEVARLVFMRRARELGFTLDEVRALLKLAAADDRGTCIEVREISVAHLSDVRARIADLRAIERVLAAAVRQCDAGQQPGCPLIDAVSR